MDKHTWNWMDLTEDAYFCGNDPRHLEYACGEIAYKMWQELEYLKGCLWELGYEEYHWGLSEDEEKDKAQYVARKKKVMRKLRKFIKECEERNVDCGYEKIPKGIQEKSYPQSGYAGTYPMPVSSNPDWDTPIPF